PNQFPDGRPVKSTSIGIRNSEGRYIAALCLNLDVSALSPLIMTLANVVETGGAEAVPVETLSDRRTRQLRDVIEAFAAERSQTPRGLGREAKRELVRWLHREGYFESRSSALTIANLLGVSRASVYNYAKQK
ncbi:MAG: hypothetical protein K0R62_5645, partial [Nonomuraea muscovyensis]|nr:hypothetical protein [Nonomuraea muscovyensis]